MVRTFQFLIRDFTVRIMYNIDIPDGKAEREILDKINEFYHMANVIRPDQFDPFAPLGNNEKIVGKNTIQDAMNYIFEDYGILPKVYIAQNMFLYPWGNNPNPFADMINNQVVNNREPIQKIKDQFELNLYGGK